MSRESEKIFEAVGQAEDGQIEEAQLGRSKRIHWIAPLAAVIALAVALTVFLSGPGKGGTAYAVAEAKYPHAPLPEARPQLMFPYCCPKDELSAISPEGSRRKTSSPEAESLKGA